MRIVYATQEFPPEWTGAIFLVGPTPRSDNPVPSWRPQAIAYLEEAGYDGIVIVPETEDGEWKHGYDDQVEWEKKGLEFADIILCWVPRDLDSMPAFTTNVEFGRSVDGMKVVYGRPPDAPKTRYLDWMLADATEGTNKPHDSLQATVAAAMERIGQGAMRSDGERYVPLHVWNTQMFQDWYKAQVAVGNRLDEAKLLWQFRIHKIGLTFATVLWVKVWIESENRHKENEFIFSRPDISSVVLWAHGPRAGLGGELSNVLDTEIILVREFRSPVRNAAGFVYEVAGGSSFKPNKDPFEVASSEVHEETGIIVPPDRFQKIASRQIAATLSTHQSHLFAAQLSRAEMDQAKALASAGEAHGVEEDSERTYVEVSTVREALSKELLDWSMVGMILQALINPPS